MADDNGVYVCDGSPTNIVYYENGKCFTAHKDGDSGEYFINRRVGRKYNKEFVDRTLVFVLYKTYRKHSFHKEYCSIICQVKSIDGISKKFCLVINDWLDRQPQKAFTLPCHGNAKSERARNTPFIRTEKNVLNSMKKRYIQTGIKPQATYHQAIKV